MQDITAQQADQAQIARLLTIAEQRALELETIISAIADSVVIYGPTGKILHMNQAAEALLGYPQEYNALPTKERLELLGVTTPDGTPADPAQLPFARALRGEVVLGENYLIHTAHGGRKWVVVSAAPLYDPRGALSGAVVTLADITPVRALQQQQEEMLHLVSHDLRIPLTVINGHTELLELQLAAHGLAEVVTEHTAPILRNVCRLQVMIQDLVDMAGLEGRQFTLHRTPLSLHRFVPELLCRVSGALPVSRVRVEIPDDLPPVPADADRLERVLLNLLSNACKYSPEDAPVHVRAWQAEGRVYLAVRDHGRGIAPQDVPHIFDRFYRARGERKAAGIGLGLYITRLLVEAHHGTVTVDTPPRRRQHLHRFTAARVSHTGNFGRASVPASRA